MRNPELDGDLAYIQKLFAPEDGGLKAIRSRLRENNREGVNVSPVEGKILQFLVRAFNCKKVVEVGALYGYSATWIARALPPDGKLFTLDVLLHRFTRIELKRDTARLVVPYYEITRTCKK